MRTLILIFTARILAEAIFQSSFPVIYDKKLELGKAKKFTEVLDSNVKNLDSQNLVLDVIGPFEKKEDLKAKESTGGLRISLSSSDTEKVSYLTSGPCSADFYIEMGDSSDPGALANQVFKDMMINSFGVEAVPNPNNKDPGEMNKLRNELKSGLQKKMESCMSKQKKGDQDEKKKKEGIIDKIKSMFGGGKKPNETPKAATGTEPSSQNKSTSDAKKNPPEKSPDVDTPSAKSPSAADSPAETEPSDIMGKIEKVEDKVEELEREIDNAKENKKKKEEDIKKQSAENLGKLDKEIEEEKRKKEDLEKKRKEIEAAARKAANKGDISGAIKGLDKVKRDLGEVKDRLKRKDSSEESKAGSKKSSKEASEEEEEDEGPESEEEEEGAESEEKAEKAPPKKSLKKKFFNFMKRKKKPEGAESEEEAEKAPPKKSWRKKLSDFVKRKKKPEGAESKKKGSKKGEGESTKKKRNLFKNVFKWWKPTKKEKDELDLEDIIDPSKA